MAEVISAKFLDSITTLSSAWTRPLVVGCFGTHGAGKSSLINLLCVLCGRETGIIMRKSPETVTTMINCYCAGPLACLDTPGPYSPWGADETACCLKVAEQGVLTVGCGFKGGECVRSTEGRSPLPCVIQHKGVDAGKLLLNGDMSFEDFKKEVMSFANLVKQLAARNVPVVVAVTGRDRFYFDRTKKKYLDEVRAQYGRNIAGADLICARLLRVEHLKDQQCQEALQLVKKLYDAANSHYVECLEECCAPITADQVLASALS